MTFEALERRVVLSIDPNSLATTGVYAQTVEYVATGSGVTNTAMAKDAAAAFSKDTGGVIYGGGGASSVLFNYGVDQNKEVQVNWADGTTTGVGTGYGNSGGGSYASGSPLYNLASWNFASVIGGAANDHVVEMGVTVLSITGRDYGNVTGTARLASGGTLTATRHVFNATAAGDTFYGFVAPANDSITGFSLGYDGSVYGTPDTRLWFDDVAFVTAPVGPVLLTAAPDNYAVNKSQPLTTAAPGVLANDTDSAGGVLQTRLIGKPAHGTLAFNADGSFTYTPSANYLGPDGFVYQAYDGSYESNTATVSLNVTGVDDPPVAGNDVYAITQDNPLVVAAPGLLRNDGDPNAQTLSVVNVTQPAHGALSANADGSFTYTPAAGYSGPDGFTYQASDGTLTSGVATVSLNVTPFVGSIRGVLYNDANGTHVLDTSGQTRLAGQTVYLDQNQDGVLDNGERSVTTSAIGSYAFTGLAPGTYYVASVLPTGWSSTAPGGSASHPVTLGVVTSTLLDFNELASTADQTIGPYHKAGYTIDSSVSQPTVFTVYGSGNTVHYAGSPALTSQWLPVTITLKRDDGSPFTLNSMDLSTFWSSVYNVTVSFNGTKADGTKVQQSFAIGSQLGFHEAMFNGFTNLTSVSWSATNVNDGHEFDNVSLQTSGRADLLSFNLGIARNPPVGVSDGYTATKSTPLTVPAASGVLANDNDPAGLPLTATLSSSPTHGTVSLNPDGSFTYTPTAGYLGTDGFGYRAGDGVQQSAVTTVSLTITGVDDPPVALDDSYSILGNSVGNLATTISAPGVLANDSDPNGQTITALLVSQPAHGTISLAGNGSFFYTPAANFYGTDSFTYQDTDGTLLSRVATVTLQVIHAPVAVPESYTVSENATLSVAAPGILANDSYDDSITLTVVISPSHGTFTYKADGSFTYVPNLNFSGTDQFKYVLSDGKFFSQYALDTINVTFVYQPPVAPDTSYTVAENSSLNTVAATSSLVWNNSIPPYTYGPNDGTYTSSVIYGYGADIEFRASAGGLANDYNLKFVAPGQQHLFPGIYLNATRYPFQGSGPGIDINVGSYGPNTESGQFTVYQAIYDASGNVTSFAADFTDYPDNAPAPWTGRIVYHSTMGLPASVLFTASDPEGASLSAALVSGPSHGTLAFNPDGTFSYTPNAGFFGIDSFTYKANDGQIDSKVATATINVTAASATFVKADTTTQGSWKLAYGGDGFAIAQDPSANNPSQPPYVNTPVTSTGTPYTWNPSTTDPRALQQADGSNNRLASAWYGNAFSFDLPTTGGPHQFALFAVDWDKVGRTETVQLVDDATGTVIDTEALANFQNGAYLVWTVKGSVTLMVTNTGPGNAVVSGLFLGGAPQPAVVTPLPSDTTTQGAWKTAAGGEGYVLAQDPTNNTASSLPVGVTVASTGTPYTWTASGTTDVRALQETGLGATARVASAWYGGAFSITVGLPDNTTTHKLSVYALDWDGVGRTETVQVLDTATGVVLDTRNLTGFQNGVYLAWNVKGGVTLKVTNTGPGNAVVSGVFLGGAPQATATASFVGSDATTQGQWKGVYGSAGFAIAQDPSANNPSQPAYVSAPVTSTGTPYTWNPSTSDPRALQQADGSNNRLASAWYGDTFSFNVPTTGGTHRLALYALDDDNVGRTETVQIIDTATGVVLDTQSLTGFQNGKYLVWNVSGNVTVRVTNTGPGNAVVSGLFFD